MGQIQILSDDLVNKIAAGEVVERPSSALKELIDNGMDAGAQWIHVSLLKGGIESLVVSDDGCGMEREDAFLALKRHATSKIKSMDDLLEVRTMGFRGEALAAIGAVCQLTLSTVRQGAESGVRLVVDPENQKVGNPRELPWSGPGGTTVAIDKLFYNVPAREKFLKTPAVEYGSCLELIHAVALSHPQLGISLKHQGKEQFRAPPLAVNSPSLKGEQALRERAQMVLGKDAAQLIYVTKKGRFGSLEGLISPPGLCRSTSKGLFAFVNNRWVKDKVIRQAVTRAYHSHLAPGKFPWAVLHLSVDPTLIDVNVHPAKTEVRFQYPQEIHNLIVDSFREGLRSGDWVMPTDPAGSLSSPSSGAPQPLFGATYREDSQKSSFPGDRVTRQIFNPTLGGPQRFPTLGGSGSEPEPSLIRETVSRETFQQKPFQQESFQQEFQRTATSDEAVPPWDQLEYVGAFAQCYLIFRSHEALLFVDQHAFHERILYEKLLKNDGLLKQSQRLLVPEGLEMSALEMQTILNFLPELSPRGFDFAQVGATTLEIRAVPTLLVGRDLVELFGELARGSEMPVSNGELSHGILAKIACHSAVRAGEDLMPGELRRLLAEAREVDFYHNCPHGRRVFRWWKKNQVGQWFDRP
jgi:DNA mismatch repair protein MutL